MQQILLSIYYMPAILLAQLRMGGRDRSRQNSQVHVLGSPRAHFLTETDRKDT